MYQPFPIHLCSERVHQLQAPLWRALLSHLLLALTTTSSGGINAPVLVASIRWAAYNLAVL